MEVTGGGLIPAKNNYELIDDVDELFYFVKRTHFSFKSFK